MFATIRPDEKDRIHNSLDESSAIRAPHPRTGALRAFIRLFRKYQWHWRSHDDAQVLADDSRRINELAPPGCEVDRR
jgi:hypothetical protein